jgi:CcmD family protein
MPVRRLLYSLCLGLTLAAGPSSALALSQPATPPTSPPPATDGFVPVTDLPPDETLPAAPLLIGAYSFIWLALLVYVAMLWRRLVAVQKDLDALKRTTPR